MKKRTGFVSNSSSSSFVCDVCGAAEGGMDFSLSDAGMVECVNEHTFCESHLLDVEEKEPPAQEKRDTFIRAEKESLAHWEKSDYKKAEEYAQGRKCTIHFLKSMDDDELDEYFYYGEGATDWEQYIDELGVSSSVCPLCQFQSVTDKDLAEFALSELGWTREFALNTIKVVFETYENFREVMKSEN